MFLVPLLFNGLMKEEHLKKLLCGFFAHQVSSQDQCYYMCIWSTGDITEENGLYAAYGWVKQQKLCKSWWNCNVLLCLGQTFSSCSLTVYLQVCCVGSAHLIQLWLGSDQSSFQLHWALEFKKKENWRYRLLSFFF